MINEIKKFKVEVVRAMNFIFLSETPLSLLIKRAIIPNIGVKSKDNNNIGLFFTSINPSIMYIMMDLSHIPLMCTIISLGY